MSKNQTDDKIDEEYKIVEEYKIGKTTIKICDRSYSKKSKEDVKSILEKCAKIANTYGFQ